MKKIIAVILTVVMFASIISGCGKKKVSTKNQALFKTDFSKYKSSDEIPDWQGDQLSIIKWVQAANPTSTLDKSSSLKNDPITAEIKRITGIDYNLDESFDNADSSFDAVIAKLIASNNFPHIAEGIPDASSLIKNNYLWEIGDYVKEYAPTVYKMFGPDSGTLYAKRWEKQIKDYGGVYDLAIAPTTEPMRPLVEAGILDIPMDKVNAVCNVKSPYPSIAVREDVLKKLYPNAYTNAQLEEIYNKNGKFTEKEIFDIPIESPQDFVDLLYKIRDLEIKENDKDTYATFTHTGMDNWPALQQLGSMFGFVNNQNPSASYFSYYDLKDKEIKPGFKSKWLKDILKTYNKMIRDGVASEEALVDTNNVFKEKLNNGKYIVAYGSYIPSDSDLREGIQYRKVYAKYKTNTNDTLFVDNDYTKYNTYTFFKDSLSEEQLIQVLRMFEFLVSDAGEKLCFWGTKKMGLYKEDKNGNLQYTDEQVKNQMINSTKYGYDKIAELGLKTSVWPGRICNYATKYFPPLSYVSEYTTWKKAYDPGSIESLKTYAGMQPLIYSDAFLNKFPEAKNFWNARNGFEEALVKIFAAQTDDEFEKKYKIMVRYAEDNGLTDEFYKKATKWYNDEYNKEYMDLIK